jgi:hypothetical protein
MMSPDAAGTMQLHLPIAIVDRSRAPSILDAEARGRPHVEGQHPVVSMAAEREFERHSSLLGRDRGLGPGHAGR